MDGIEASSEGRQTADHGKRRRADYCDVGAVPAISASRALTTLACSAALPAPTPEWLRGGITVVILYGMKTAISIPDEIFEQAERLAKTRGWSRSELYANAVSAFVNSERFSGVREKLDAVYGDGGQDSVVEPLIADSQARSIAKEKW